MDQIKENVLYACPNCEMPLDVSDTEEPMVKALVCAEPTCAKPGTFKMFDVLHDRNKALRAEILEALTRYPDYRVLMCSDEPCYQFTPWTDDFKVVISHATKTIAFNGEMT